MNYLITGGCGFIGTRLIRVLVAAGGHRIRVLDNLSEGSRETLSKVCAFNEVQGEVGSLADADPGAVELVVGDIRTAADARAAARGAEVIVHLAANTGVGPSVEDPRSDCEANVLGTLNMLEAARHEGVWRFVFASSGAPVGECEPPIHEELPAHPVSPYGASKLAGEAYCSAFYRSFGVATVALRFSNVYGPGSGAKQSVVARFIRRALAGEDLEIYGDGLQTRDFLFVDDLVQAVLRAAVAEEVGGEAFQVATGEGTTLLELVETLVGRLEKAGVEGTRVTHTGTRVGDVRFNYSDTSKAARVLGWGARVGLEEGLERTLEWFLEERPS